MRVWFDAATTKPTIGSSILMKGDSGYRAPHDTFYVAGFYDPEFRPHHPWLNCCSDQLADYGWEPEEWAYLADIEHVLEFGHNYDPGDVE